MAGPWRRLVRSVSWLGARIAGLGLAALTTWSVFMLLPLLELATHPKQDELAIRNVDTANLPPPPPPPPAEPPKESEPEESPPELSEPSPLMDLSALEMALQPTVGDGVGGLAMRLPGMADAQASSEAAEAIFSASELDQKPRATAQPPPEYPADLRRRKVEGTVVVVFTVDRNGRVVQPTIEQSPHPQLASAALAAVRRWRFEPGRRQGRPVPFRMRVPITFRAQ